MEIYYVNNKNEKIYFDREPYKMLSGTTLFDYKHEYSYKGNNSPKIYAFRNKLVSHDIGIAINGKDAKDYTQNLKRFLHVVDKDIFDVSPGKLYVGDYYLSGYFAENKKNDRYVNAKNSTVSLTFVSESGLWTREIVISYTKIINDLYDIDGLDYAYGYDYDYSNTLVNKKIVNNNYAPSDFKLTVYGGCINPAISIGTHTYTVTAELITGEYLEINSRTKKIYKVKNNGNMVNLFHFRGRDFNVFEKIPTGSLPVAWNGSFGFDVTLLEERSEPIWN